MFGNHERWPAAALAGGLAALVALAGCGSYTSVPSRSVTMGAMDHPAPPLTASPGQPARTLTSDPLDAPAASSVLDAQRSAAMAAEMGGMSHGGSTYRQVDAGHGPGADEGSGQEPSHAHAAGATHEEAAVYTCPMHPEVTAAAPGKCPKCGMTLVKRRQG